MTIIDETTKPHGERPAAGDTAVELSLDHDTASALGEGPPEKARLLDVLLERKQAEAAPLELPSRLPVTAITRLEELFQPCALNPSHLHDLGQVLKTKKYFDPLTVIQIGREAVLVDGHHRWTAYDRAKVSYSIPVTYFDGTVADAVIASGEENQKAKLPMTNPERMNRAWALVTMGRFSKAQESKGSGASLSQIGEMRALRQRLIAKGSDPAAYAYWWQATQADKGRATDIPEWTEDRLDELATEYAKAMKRAVGERLTNNPEVTALALRKLFGWKLPELDQHLAKYVAEESPEGDEDDEDDLPF